MTEGDKMGVCALEVLRQIADRVGIFETWVFGTFGTCFGSGTQKNAGDQAFRGRTATGDDKLLE